jgi:hypothetical protein
VREDERKLEGAMMREPRSSSTGPVGGERHEMRQDRKRCGEEEKAGWTTMTEAREEDRKGKKVRSV